jgi:hypothetical protein
VTLFQQEISDRLEIEQLLVRYAVFRLASKRLLDAGAAVDRVMSWTAAKKHSW